MVDSICMIETFVHIETGRQVDAGYVNDSGDRFWEKGDLRKDGTPDRRKPAHYVGLQRLINGEVVGRWVPLNEDTELLAYAHRERIAKLEAELKAAKIALREMYFSRKSENEAGDFQG